MPSPFEGAGHRCVEPTLEVRLPRWIVRVRLSLHLDMALDAYVRRIEQPRGAAFAAYGDLALERPRPSAVCSEVLASDPLDRLS